jgi:release factor glutamine methyltransferase
MQRLELVNREREEATAEQLGKLQDMAARRLKGEPVVRIIGEKEFWGLSFKLNAATLVPRPETEMLVVRTLAILEGRSNKRVLDLGTGTGCIAISILTESPSAHAVATDISPEAVAMARGNGERHGVGKRLEVRAGPWFDPLDTGESFDVIVSNPPYIERAVIETLKPDVRDFDPRAALDGGPDGLDAYRAILNEAKFWMKPDGAIVVETGAEQGPKVSRLFRESGLKDVAIEKDLAGLDRVVTGYHS